MGSVAGSTRIQVQFWWDYTEKERLVLACYEKERLEACPEEATDTGACARQIRRVRALATGACAGGRLRPTGPTSPGPPAQLYNTLA